VYAFGVISVDPPILSKQRKQSLIGMLLPLLTVGVFITDVIIDDMAIMISLRSVYGTDKTHNAVHSSDSKDSAAREVDLVFNNFIPNPLQTTYVDIFFFPDLSFIGRLWMTS
jgi:hypothetical protein